MTGVQTCALPIYIRVATDETRRFAEKPRNIVRVEGGLLCFFRRTTSSHYIRVATDETRRFAEKPRNRVRVEGGFFVFFAAQPLRIISNGTEALRVP